MGTSWNMFQETEGRLAWLGGGGGKWREVTAVAGLCWALWQALCTFLVWWECVNPLVTVEKVGKQGGKLVRRPTR